MSISNPVRPCGSGSVYTPSGGGNTLNFVNLGSSGARVLSGLSGNNVQFRRISNGTNTTVVENTNDININVTDLAFDSSAAITRPVIGLSGVVLGKSTLLDTVRELLYPIISPVAQFTLSRYENEYGDIGPITLSWIATRTSEAIIAIAFTFPGGSGTPGTITGNTQSGTLLLNTSSNSNSVFTMTVTTATKTVTVTATIIIERKIRYGTSVKNGITPNDITDSDVNGLTGVFSTTATLGQTLITVPAASYLIIEIPLSLGTSPTFKINGLVNNDFTKRRSNDPFINSFGYSENVDVYVSNAIATGLVQLEIV